MEEKQSFNGYDIGPDYMRYYIAHTERVFIFVSEFVVIKPRYNISAIVYCHT